MSSPQKILVALLVILTGLVVSQSRSISNLRRQNHQRRTEQQRASDEMERLQRERDLAIEQAAASHQKVIPADSQAAAKIQELRAEANRLRVIAQQANDPFVQTALIWKARKEKLQRMFQDRPDQYVPEMKLLSDNRFLDIAREQDLESETDIRNTMSLVRCRAKEVFASQLCDALGEYVKEHDDQLPTDLLELTVYFTNQEEDYSPILKEYRLLHSGKVEELHRQGISKTTMVSDTRVVDPDFDSLMFIGPGGYGGGRK